MHPSRRRAFVHSPGVKSANRQTGNPLSFFLCHERPPATSVMNDLFDKSRRPDARVISIRGAREHNLKNVDLEHPARQAGRDHRPVGLGQVVARLRHHLCRGPAPLCREPVGLCAPVPRDDAEAGRRPDRRPVAGHLDRAEDHLAQPALDRRHGHRDLRLHAPALGARRRALFAGHRPADREPDRVSQMVDRVLALPEGTRLYLLAPDRARPQGRVPQGARRLHEARASSASRSTASSTRSTTRRRSTRSSSTTSTWWSTASWCAPTSASASPRASRPRSKLADGIAIAEFADDDRQGARQRVQERSDSAAVLGEVRLPGLRLHHPRDRAAAVLVQQPVRRLPGLRRPRRRAEDRRRPGRPRRGRDPAQGRDRAVGEVDLALLHARRWRRSPSTSRFTLDSQWKDLPEKAQDAILYGTGRGADQLRL